MNRCENLQKLLKKYCQHQQASMQYTSTQREEEEEGEKRGKVQGSRAGNKSKGQKNHLTTTSWAKQKERETSQNSQHFYNDTIKGVKGEGETAGGRGGEGFMEVALQLSADRCERGYELNTRTLNNSRSTYSAHFGQRGSLKGRGEGG